MIIWPSESIQKPKNKRESNAALIAGNLSEEKGYVYQLDQIEAEFSLYGPNLNAEAVETDNITYQGSFPPDDLPSVLNGKFGPLWMESIDECGGESGQYMQYNNPHKTSLYLASKLPVIVWEKAVDGGVYQEPPWEWAGS